MDREFVGDARFRVVECLGRGGMGTVYRVFDRESGIEVALKTIRDRSPEQVYRLKNEFRALAGIVHENLIQLFDLVVRDDACFFTMEFVPGADFVTAIRLDSGRPMRPSQRYERFRRAALQLVHGLTALHAAGRLHRDLKPANVRIDPTDRVVILDFDLALPTDSRGAGLADDTGVAGTFACMAPEQLWGMGVSQASDWFSVGVLFCEALTGWHPFEGRPPPAPGQRPLTREELPAWDPELPEPLAESIVGLLHPDPAARPSTRELLAVLDHETPTATWTPLPIRAAPQRLFVGRDRELAALRSWLRARDGVRIAGLSGPSGIGKTALATQLLGEFDTDPHTITLRGRCHPQEAIPFKALDPVVDAMTRELLVWPAEERRSVLPDDLSAAMRLFPVLARLQDRTAPASGPVLDVAEARRRGVGSLRELLRRLGQARRLVVWVDDAQWSDADSAALFTELLRPPGAPSLALVLTYRGEVEESGPLLPELRALASEFSALGFEEIFLEPLSAADALAVARQLCPAGLVSEAELADLIGQTAGSPFLLQELLWYLRSERPGTPSEGPAAPRLADALASRIRRLPPLERRLLDLVSVCGLPTDRRLVLRAAEIGERGRHAIQRLEDLGLLRSAPVRGQPLVETYHDRIRETVLGRLDDDDAVGCHRALALSFEAAGHVEPEILAQHFAGARMWGRASDYAVDAANRATELLAFERAAMLYRDARAWDPRSSERERDLRAREADALANAARLVESGRLFLEAAEGATSIDALELRRRSAEHLLSGGAVDEGLAALRALLGELGVPHPASARDAMRRAIGLLAVAALRRPPSGTEDPSLPVLERIRIDTCYGAGKNLVDADPARGIYFTLAALVRAQRTGDALRTARALTIVGGSISVVGGPLARLGERMFRQAEALAAQLDMPELWGTIDLARGQVEMLAGRSGEAVTRCDAGIRRLTHSCRGFALETNLGRTSALRALEDLGQLDQVAIRAQELRDAATATGNRYAETAAIQYLAISRLAAGATEEARELARHGRQLWTRRDFHIQHLYAVRIETLCDLYEGRPEDGWERLEGVDASLRASGLLRIPLTRVDVLALRGRLALAAASRSRTAETAWLRALDRHLRPLSRIRRLDAALHVHLLHAGRAAHRAAFHAAQTSLEAAIETGERAGSALLTAAARLHRAQLLDDVRAAEAVRTAMRRGGVHDPDRWAHLVAPGFSNQTIASTGATPR